MWIPFSVEKSLELSSFAEQSTQSWTSDIGLLNCHHQLLSMVLFCILNHIDSTETRCRFNVVWSLSGGRGFSPPKSLQCSQCDDETNYTSITELYDHSVAVHLPKPSPVSLPIASVAKSFSVRLMSAVLEGTTPALEDALMVDDAKKRRLTRRKSGGGGRGSATPSKEREAGARGDAVPHRLEKEARRLLQKHHTADGHHHQAVSEDRTGNEVTVRSHLRHDHHGNGARRGEKHTRPYHEGVQALGKGHTLGPPQIWAWGGLIAGLQKQGAAVGAANAATLTGYLKQLDGMSMDTKCDHVRFCRVDRTYQSEQARITLAVDRSSVRDPVVNALQQLGAARKYGRAPPTQQPRELQQWLDIQFDK